MIDEPLKDIVVLLADVDAENAFRGILSRHESLQVPAFDMQRVDIHRHVQRDPGCYKDAENFLRPFVRTHRYAMVMFDRHGSGAEQDTAEAIERHVEARLSSNGWPNRCGVIVPDPELEIWVWSESPNVDRVLGWAGKQPCLRDWLLQRGLIRSTQSKPADPKSAMRACLREQHIPISARLFRALANRVSFERCQDRAFRKLKRVLQGWFGG